MYRILKYGLQWRLLVVKLNITWWNEQNQSDPLTAPIFTHMMCKFSTNKTCDIRIFFKIQQSHNICTQSKVPLFSIYNQYINISENGYYTLVHSCRQILAFVNVKYIQMKQTTNNIMKNSCNNRKLYPL